MVNWKFWKPAPKPTPAPPKGGDSSTIERGGTPERQGPQRPGEGFTSGGGSAPISSGNTVGGGSSGGSSGGSRGGGSSSNVPQIGSITVTTEEAKKLGNTNKPVTVVTKGSSFGGGLSSQVKTAPVKSISQAGPLSSMAGTERTSGLQATKAATKDVITNLGIAFGGQRGNYLNPFERFSPTGKEKSQQTAYLKPQFGTKQTTGFDIKTNRLIETGAYKPVTFLEVQQETEFKRDIRLQESSKRFGGMVTEKTTEQELADINKQYKSEQNKIYSELPDVQGFTTRSGQGLVTTIPAVLETGALIGASTLGGPVGLGVASAYTFGQGFKQTVEAENNLDRALGLTTIGLSGFGAKASLFNIEKSIISGELASLSKQPVNFKQIQVQQGDKSIVGFEAFQKQGGLTRQISGRGVAFKEGDNIFVIPKGNVKIKTTGSLGWNIYGPTETNIFAEQAGTFGSKSAFKQIDDFTFSVGKSTFIPKYSTSSIYGLDTTKRKVTRFTTNFKLGGEQINSFSFLSSKQAPQDVYGNERFFSAGFGIKGGKVIKPAQFGTTIVISGEKLPKFSGGLADDSLSSTFKFMKGKGRGGNIISELYGTKTLSSGSQTQLLKQVSSNKISTGLDFARLSDSSSKSIMSGNLLLKQSFAAPVTLSLQKQETKSLNMLQTKTMFKPAMISLTSQDLGLLTKQKTRVNAISGYKTLSLYKTELKQLGILSQTQRMSEKQLTRQKTITNIPNIPGYNFNVGLPDLGLRGFGLPVGLELYDRGYTRRPTRGKSFKGRYAPTITAIGLNLKANQIDKLYKGGAGAFSIRPLLNGGKRNVRRKKGR